jgi:hypothetical protein
MDKRGEQSTINYVLTTILMVLGLGILLFFIFRFGFDDSGEREVCKLAVLSRASAPETVNTYIPLECDVKKICMKTKVFGNCDSNFAGEENVDQVHLSSDDIKAARQIEETIAEEMYNCWSMMGEGKLSLFSGGFKNKFPWAVSYPTCVICSRIAFNTPDRDIFSYTDINTYLRETKISEKGITYMSYFTDNSIRAYPLVSDQSKLFDNALAALNKNEQPIKTSKDNNEIAIVFSQVQNKDFEERLSSLKTAGVAVAGTSAFLSPGILMIAATNPITTIGVVGVGVGGLALYTYTNYREGVSASAGYCGKLTTEKEGIGEGCSSIQVIPYNPESIRQVCKTLEGNL